MENNDKAYPLRRNRIDLMTSAEKSIVDAVNQIEKTGCDPLLTKAINLLHEARELVADFVEGSLNSERTIPWSAEDTEEFKNRLLSAIPKLL